MLFDWYSDGDTPSQMFSGFRLSAPSARFFDALAARVGAAVAGRATYEHSGHWGGDGPHPTARLFVPSHRPAPEISAKQTLVTGGSGSKPVVRPIRQQAANSGHSADRKPCLKAAIRNQEYRADGRC